MFKTNWKSTAKAVLVSSFLLAVTGCSTEKEAVSEKPIAPAAATPDIEVPAVIVKKMQLNHMIEIPGELKAFQNVAIEAKVQGYVSAVNVDRGSKLKTGQKILTIFCPELDEHLKEEEAKSSSAVSSLRKSESNLESTKSKLLEAKARLDADLLTLRRLNDTSAKMPGAVAVNDIDIQSKTVEFDKARVESMGSEVKAAGSLIESDQSNVKAAKNVEQSVKSLQSYLTITAPFDGIITERNVHVGSMVGPQQTQIPMLRISQENRLRLVVAMPEDSVAGLQKGARIPFNVPAYPGKQFYGVVERPAFAIDAATRTMPVELDVSNGGNELQPGMFATVHWRLHRPFPTLFVPSSAVATDLKGTFVNQIDRGVCRRVPAQKGRTMDDLVEIVGDIKEGDKVALKATDELKEGTHLVSKLVSVSNVGSSN